MTGGVWVGLARKLGWFWCTLSAQVRVSIHDYCFGLFEAAWASHSWILLRLPLA